LFLRFIHIANSILYISFYDNTILCLFILLWVGFRVFFSMTTAVENILKPDFQYVCTSVSQNSTFRSGIILSGMEQTMVQG
jgi:hypothetical protein